MKPFLIQKIPPCHLSELPQKGRDCLVATQFSAILIWANQNNFSYNSQTRIRTLYFGGIPFLNHHMLHHLDSFGPKMASLIGICPEFVDTENWRSFRIFALTPKCLTNKIPRKEQALPHCIHHFLRSFFPKPPLFLGAPKRGSKHVQWMPFFFRKFMFRVLTTTIHLHVWFPLLMIPAIELYSIQFCWKTPELPGPSKFDPLSFLFRTRKTTSKPEDHSVTNWNLWSNDIKRYKYQNTEILSNPWWTVSCLVCRLLISESLGPPRMPVSTRSITVLEGKSL